MDTPKRHAPELNFITLHYIYFLLTCLICSGIFWGVSTPPRSVSYVDSVFLVVSAMTLAGLNTLNLSELNTFQQIMLFLLIMLGSAILVSSIILAIRKTAFERRFRGVLEKKRAAYARSATLGSRLSLTLTGGAGDLREDNIDLMASEDTVERTTDITFAESPRSELSPTRSLRASKRHSRIVEFNGVGAVSSSTSLPHARQYSAEPVVEGRNSKISGLTNKEREQLGGVEYRAVSFLTYLVPAYFVLWQLFGAIGMGGYVALNRPSTARENGLDPWWVGAFNAISAFNNSGMSLLDANMVAFQTSAYTLLTAGLLILAGNTCYPIFLRLIIWTIRKLTPDSQNYATFRETLDFLLKHPRRCYTNLFPARHTWWLLAVVIVLNTTDWVAFEILNIGNEEVMQIPANYRVLDGLFQAFAVRSGGFYVAPISKLRIGLQILYVLMMYISVYPVVITIRNSNVYEERSLGIFSDEAPSQSEKGPRLIRFARSLTDGNPTNHRETRSYFVRHQLRAQLAHDAWWIALAVLIISTIETGQFERDPQVFSVFNVILEVVSGYGCVGISTGVPWDNYSFCGAWHTASKLVLCAVMLRGRHRGLPVAIDRAVLLPGEHLKQVEEEEEARHGRTPATV